MGGRLWAISDLHVDFQVNLEAVMWLAAEPHHQDGLIVAGDISHDFERLKLVLRLLRSSFGRVYFVPGNHDLWVRGPAGPSEDSLGKFKKLLDWCRLHDIRFTPELFKGEGGSCWIVPLFSWHRPVPESAEREPLVSMEERFCRWPEGFGSPERFFLDLNRPFLKTTPAHVPIVSFSYFLPRADLTGWRPDRTSRVLATLLSDPRLDEQIRELGSSVHVFGHSHDRCDRVINGVRYLQNPIGYPRERGAVPVRLAPIAIEQLVSPLGVEASLDAYPV